jgi:hypothetical protein
MSCSETALDVFTPALLIKVPGDAPCKTWSQSMRLPYTTRGQETKMKVPSEMWRSAYEGLDKCSRLAAGCL